MIEKQVIKMKQDIECHWQELSALNSMKSSKKDETDIYLELEIDKIKSLIKGKQDLIKTLEFDFNIK